MIKLAGNPLRNSALVDISKKFTSQPVFHTQNLFTGVIGPWIMTVIKVEFQSLSETIVNHDIIWLDHLTTVIPAIPITIVKRIPVAVRHGPTPVQAIPGLLSSLSLGKVKDCLLCLFNFLQAFQSNMRRACAVWGTTWVDVGRGSGWSAVALHKTRQTSAIREDRASQVHAAGLWSTDDGADRALHSGPHVVMLEAALLGSSTTGIKVKAERWWQTAETAEGPRPLHLSHHRHHWEVLLWSAVKRAEMMEREIGHQRKLKPSSGKVGCSAKHPNLDHKGCNGCHFRDCLEVSFVQPPYNFNLTLNRWW